MLKKELLDACYLFVDSRMKKLQLIMSDLQESLLSETKSSAGDKHETGRAMLQLEREKTGNQLAEVLKLKEMLKKVDINSIGTSVRLGSVVYTDHTNYFIAISAGQLIFNSTSFFAIAPNTPIGKLMIGKKAGDEIIFNGKRIIIDKII